MDNKKAKIVMITMFKNESRVIKRMLDSCKPYIDYYVMQNNGSTDGTDVIAKQFLEENNLAGEIYNVEEGWVGFGWNRDHLIQYCQKSTNHGCDWILKMDCDEVLQVDDDFDWSIFDNTNIRSFNITAIGGNCIYHRCWMWNAKLPWRFNHDDAHETIYCEIPEIGTDYAAVNVPTKFKHIGYNEGQSYSVPTKYVTDALKLEEKLIREDTMLKDLYHFWYVGKSYNDCYRGNFFPLKQSHSREYAKRCIFYFTEYINHVFKDTGVYEHELVYNAYNMVADAYEFLGDSHTAIKMYEYAHKVISRRNEHLFGLARVAEKVGDYEKMFWAANIMNNPERVCPFPNYVVFLITTLYIDGGPAVTDLYARAKSLYEGSKESKAKYPLILNTSRNKRMFIVDNFYKNPDEVRAFALQQEFKADIRWYKGLRTTQPFRTPEIKSAFERIMGERIVSWEDNGVNGCFQITTAEDPQVYHHDSQKWAAMIYLSPNAPYESGTRLHTSKINGVGHMLSGKELIDQAFSVGFYDSTKFNVVDSAGNVYNRLVIMDAQCIHSAGPYFGNSPETGRLTHLFFFD